MKRTAIVIVLCAVGFVRTARADEPVEPPAAPAPDPVADEARARYRRGIELFDDGDYRLALVELERAYAILPNYKVLYNIAQVHFQLNEYAKARAAFERYLKEGGADVPDTRRAEVEKELQTLRTRVATISVQVNVDSAEVTVNGEVIGKGGVTSVVVDAGVLKVQAAAQGFGAQTKVVKLAGGDSTTVVIELTRSKPDVVVTREGLSGAAVAGWITTGILVAGAVGTGIAANAASSRYDTKRTSPIQGSPQEAAADLERQQNLVNGLAITTDILAVTAIIVGGVSAYLTFFRKSSQDAAPVRVNGTRASLTVRF